MQITILDTTLRDGEQSPGVALRPADKPEIAKSLDRMGVNVIEAGFAITSPGEREGMRLVAKAGLRAEICGLARAEKNDIDETLETGIKCVHIFLATSDIHLRDKLRMTQGEVLQKAESAVAYAKSMGMKVEFSAEDATSTDIGFLKEVYRTAAKAGADRIDIPDTLGRATPKHMARLIGEMRSAVDLPISVHCHNDFGLAVANSIAAVEAGAQCVHVTVNGVGERAGNAALEEVVGILNHLKLDGEYSTSVDLKGIYETSQLVSRLYGMPVQPNKAIVGANAFSHESGIHTHGIVNNPSTYQFVGPENFGRETKIVNGKHSGVHGVEATLRKYGISAPREELMAILNMIKIAGDDGRSVGDAEVVAMAMKVENGR
jgi:2-isopropylmalate synthase